MGRPTPETGGGAPQNQGLSEFKVLRDRQGLGPRIPKPDEPKQQPSDPYHELSEHLKRNRRSAVIGGRGWGHEWFERLKDIEKG
jgi:hypothetical protein